jgi:hypothetical protein
MASPRRGGRASNSGEEDSFRSFLVGLATDPAKLGQFMKDPDGSMSDAGLAEEDKAIILSGDLGAINARIRGQAAPRPAPLLVVDMAAEDESGQATPTIRALPVASLQIYPQVVPVRPVIQPQVVYPQIVYPQIHPQIYPQVQPQIYPQIIYPQIHPQIYPQIHPQIYPQIYPLIHQVVSPMIYPQIHPVIYPQIHPLIYPEAPAGGNPVSQ